MWRSVCEASSHTGITLQCKFLQLANSQKPSVCLCINQGDAKHNRFMYRLVILHSDMDISLQVPYRQSFWTSLWSFSLPVCTSWASKAMGCLFWFWWIAKDCRLVAFSLHVDLVYCQAWQTFILQSLFSNVVFHWQNNVWYVFINRRIIRDHVFRCSTFLCTRCVSELLEALTQCILRRVSKSQWIATFGIGSAIWI